MQYQYTQIYLTPMVNWESKADRGGRSPPKGPSQRTQKHSKPTPPMEKIPPQEKAHSPAPAPRGSPIAQKLPKHALHPGSTLIVTHKTVEVGLPPNYMSTHVTPCFLLPPPRQPISISRPYYGTAVSQRRQHVPRARSPTYRASRLVVTPSGRCDPKLARL